MTVDSTVTGSTTLAPEEQKPVNETPAEPGVVQYTDGYSYEVPRPFLTLQQAAAILGKSIRSLERSMMGRWGNKLPEGWVARKLRTGNGEEWRILPPPGFRVKLSGAAPQTSSAATEYDTEAYTETFEMTTTNHEHPQAQGQSQARKKSIWKPERHSIDQPAIVIDRTEEVEHLLRELVQSQRALAEERRQHMDDMRMIHQLQSSMRLLETNANEQARIKSELELAKQELNSLKEKYERELNAPWWSKLFKSQGT
jgi:hypothetical protein